MGDGVRIHTITSGAMQYSQVRRQAILWNNYWSSLMISFQSLYFVVGCISILYGMGLEYVNMDDKLAALRGAEVGDGVRIHTTTSGALQYSQVMSQILLGRMS